MTTQLTPDDQSLLESVKKRVNGFEQTLGCFYRDGLWARMDKLYHGWTQLRAALRNTRGRDRDAVYDDARKEFGHELFIPHAYAIVETVLPALLSNRPRPLVMPRNQESEQNVENMRALIDAQGSQIDLELRLQSVVKSGLMYGLGVGKSYWLHRETVKMKPTPLAGFHPARLMGKQWTLQRVVEPAFDDPTFEHVPVRDFFWDPYAASIDAARWCAHRTWRDTAYVNARLQDPDGWSRYPLAADDIESTNGSADRYRKSITGQYEAQAIPLPNPLGAREQDTHEVLEFHDRENIITILDRQWVVNVAPNDSWYGKLPFFGYRPTEVLNQMVGKGEIEPIEDLQVEMNQIRTDRRWSDLMSMNPVLFVQEGLVEIDKIRVGPGEINLVNGDPRELIYPLEIPGPKQTSYRETAEIAADIVRASGISDMFAGGDAATAQTATGAQLEMARASARIQLKTRRAELELCKPIASHWGALNQRHVLADKQVRGMELPQEPAVMGGEPGVGPDRRWQWFTLSPAELMGEFEYDTDGGATAPDNVPQQRQDAQTKMALMSGPIGQLYDAREMAISILQDLGMKNPEGRLSQGVPVPPEVLAVIVRNLAQMGIDPSLAGQVVEAALAEVTQGQDQGAQGGQPPQAPQQQQAA